MLSCVPLIKVVGRGSPLNNPWESLKKLEPFRVIDCPELPACKVAGEILRKIGMFDDPCNNGLMTAAMLSAGICFWRYECPLLGDGDQKFDPGNCPVVGSTV